MDTEIIDQATATAALHKVRDTLILAVNKASAATDALRRVIVTTRPQGVLTVDEMAEAVGRDRNFVDSVWSSYGEIVKVNGKVKQTRVSATAAEIDGHADAALKQLVAAAQEQRAAAGAPARDGEPEQPGEVGVARAERNRVVALVYASKLIGPSAIAAAAGVDRNHVLRIARKAGVAPAWRPAGTSKNQHSKVSA